MPDSAMQEFLQNLPVSIGRIASMRVVENQWGIPALVNSEKQDPQDGLALPGLDFSAHAADDMPLRVVFALQQATSRAYPAASGQSLDDYAEAQGIESPQEAYYRWIGSKDALKWFDRNLQVGPWGLRLMSEALAGHGAEILNEVRSEVARCQAEHDRTHPPLPEGCLYIDERLEELYRELPDWAIYIADCDGYVCDAFSEVADSYVDIYNQDLLQWVGEPGNYDYVEDAVKEGLVDTQDFDMIKAIQVGQYEQIRQEMYNEFAHGELKEYIALYQLKEAGYVAVSDDLMDGIRDVVEGIDDNDQLSDISDAVTGRAEDIEIEGPTEGPRPRYTLAEIEAYNASKVKPIPSKKTMEKTPEAAERSAREQAASEPKAKEAQRQPKSRN